MRPEATSILLERNRELQRRLEEAEETLHAIRSGEVDAVVAAGPDGDRVYTLKGADEAYRVIVQDMAEGALTLTPDGLILFSNEQFASLIRVPLAHVIGARIQDFVAVEDVEVLSALLTARNRWRAELRLKVGPAGTIPVYLSINTLVLDGVQCVCVIVTDLTEQKRSQEIVAAERLARSILEQAAGAILVVDPAGSIIRASRAAEELAHGPVLSRQFDSAFPLRVSSHSNGLLFEEILSAVKRSGSVAGLQATARMSDGRTLDLLVNAALLSNPNSELLGCIIILQDITSLRRAEEARQESERRYRSLFENSLDAVFLAMTDGRVVAANPAACALFGMTEQEICQTGRDGLIDPGKGGLGTALDEHRRNGRVRCELTFLRKDGSRFVGEVNSVDVGEDGRAFVLVRDITERRKAEQDLRESEERHRLLIQASPMGLVMEYISGDRLGEIVTVNDAFLRILRHPRDELTAGPLRWTDFTPAEHLTKHMIAVAEAQASGSSKPYETEYIRKDGSRAPVMIALTVLGDQRDKAVAFIADMTEQKRAEERLRQAQKLESIGLLAGGVAHDFNNLLTGIVGNATLLLEEVAPEGAELLQAIVSSAERAAHLTRQLLAYAGKGQFVVRDVDLSQALRQMADLVRLSIPKSVELRLNLSERLPPIAIDPSQVQQIVMNLIINAGEAIGEGQTGKIMVSTDICDVDRGFVDALGADAPAGRYVCLEVADTGPGIDEETKSKIFDPFFTTKFTGRGLGLSAVSGIVRSQRGAITLQSTPGHGTTFRIFLSAPQTGGKKPVAESAGSPGVLVVDDEASVRKFISAVLRRRGYRVLEACDGREALALCKEEQGLGMVILDLIMPVMGGSEFLDQLQCKRPDLKVLLTSGYSESEARRLCAAYAQAPFIQKPYTAQQVAAAVENLFKD